ncbi:MAG TPA: hypothetical protein VEJ20_03505, partial [Candidatus Eremiobacteraceae bacterium]|nr:hypothetical protein [Candidatus Eremiobacteraceae bacterium]
MTSAALAGIASASPVVIVSRGDVLDYDLALEWQVHPQAPVPHASSGTEEESITGTASLTGENSGINGVTSAEVLLELTATGTAPTQHKNAELQLSILPSGKVDVPSTEAALFEYVEPIEEAAMAYGSRSLHAGDRFNQSIDISLSQPGTIDATATVIGPARYHGYPVFEIRWVGKGDMRGQDWTQAVTAAGTAYYDQADRLLVGFAYRADGTLLYEGS